MRDILFTDLRYAWRSINRRRGFSAVVVTMLGLGIGANTAIFSVLDAVLLRPLPYRQPEELVWVWEKPPGGLRSNVAEATFLDWRDQNDTFERICAFYGTRFILTGAEQPEAISGASVSADFFELLGIHPAMGRAFVPEEEEPGKDRVVVLSHELWANRFGADPRMLGRQLMLDGEPHTVVGVMPAGFRFRASRYQLWKPLALDRAQATRNVHYLQAVARLKVGVALDRARAEMETVAANIAKDHPDAKAGWSASVEELQSWLVGPQLRQSLYLLLAAVGFLLLIACVNVANLLLARSTTRQREMAIRCSLGADRVRLTQQLLTESSLLALLGGALAVLITAGFIKIFPTAFPAVGLPTAAVLKVDGPVLLFTLGTAVLTSVLAGLVPAWQGSRSELTETLGSKGRIVVGDRSSNHFRRALVVVEVALALLLLVSTTLLTKTLARIQAIDPGIDGENVLTVRIALPANKYSDAARAKAFYREALDRVEALPGVRAAAITRTPPLMGSTLSLPVELVGHPVADPTDNPGANIQTVSPSLFTTLGIQFRQGRQFTDSDNEGAERVAIVNERFVERFPAAAEPIGAIIRLAQLEPGQQERGAPVPWRIVGVISDVRVNGLLDDETAEVYVPYTQSVLLYAALVVRTAIEPEQLTQAVRRAIAEVDKDQPVTGVATMEQAISASTGMPALRTVLLGVFAGLAVVLASLGIYGVISFSVTQRAGEIGIRMALGATPAVILRSVIRQSLGAILPGIGLGILAGLGLTRFLAGMLFGVAPSDPLTFGAGALFLTVIGVLASYLPARRAAQVDPGDALRDRV